jgi:murein DD-endopeptidase MepM/ murein hydrolase activator NlpD
MQICRFMVLSIFILVLMLPVDAKAQDPTPTDPVYVVQYGDTLWDIAQRFRVSVDEMARANRLGDAGQINVGDQLIIPGLEGIHGRLVTVKVDYGESLRSLSRRYQVSPDLLARLNALTSPVELFVGYNLIIPEKEDQQGTGGRASLEKGESLLDMAIKQGANPYSLTSLNGLDGLWGGIPGDVLQVHGEGPEGPGALPGSIKSFEVNYTSLAQGKTAVIRILAEPGTTLGGNFSQNRLNFFMNEEGEYFALQGVHAMAAPGTYPLTISGSLQNGEEFVFTQNLYIRLAGYPQAPDLQVDEAGLDPSITLPEDERWSALAGPATDQRRWDGAFEFPSPRIYLGQYTARFGERRTYNNSSLLFFHTGLDIPGQTGTEVYAPSPGQVVFAGHLDVRGNALMIDHGWGVYSAFMHLSEFLVEPGDQVETGQLIALVGNTGLRTTGSHLHWEVLVGGVQVNPLDWMENEYP